jgi:hypothetical protein
MNGISVIGAFCCIVSAQPSSRGEMQQENVQQDSHPSLTDKTRMPSPQTPLPERARGFENLQLFLAPLLLLWEKGLGDEGKRFVSQSAHILRLK